MDLIKNANIKDVILLRKKLRDREIELWTDKFSEIGLIQGLEHAYDGYSKKYSNIYTDNPKSLKLPDFIISNFGNVRYHTVHYAVGFFEIDIRMTNLNEDRKNGEWRITIKGDTSDTTVYGGKYAGKYANKLLINFEITMNNYICPVLELIKLTHIPDWVITESDRKYDSFSINYIELRKVFTSEVLNYWKNTFSQLVFG